MKPLLTIPRPSAPTSLYTVNAQVKRVFTFINGVLTPMQEVPTYDFH